MAPVTLRTRSSLQEEHHNVCIMTSHQWKIEGSRFPSHPITLWDHLSPNQSNIQHSCSEMSSLLHQTGSKMLQATCWQLHWAGP